MPADLAGKLHGTRVIAPAADTVVSTNVGDKVIVSLGTKISKLASARFAAAFAF